MTSRLNTPPDQETAFGGSSPAFVNSTVQRLGTNKTSKTTTAMLRRNTSTRRRRLRLVKCSALVLKSQAQPVDLLLNCHNIRATCVPRTTRRHGPPLQLEGLS